MTFNNDNSPEPRVEDNEVSSDTELGYEAQDDPLEIIGPLENEQDCDNNAGPDQSLRRRVKHSHSDSQQPRVVTPLLGISEVPQHLRFNKYVFSHYRPQLDFMGCIASLTYWHNETINILTHALPAIFISAMIPWMLPWSSITVPWLPWTHVTACLAPWVGSTLYHLFMCHHSGQVAYNLLLKVDLLGIWFTQTLGALVTICAAIHCFQPESQTIFLLLYLGVCILCLYQAMTVSTVWGRRFAFTAPFIIRVVCLGLRLSPHGGGAPDTTSHVVLQDLIAIMGGYIGAVNIPEKWFPGKLDLVFNSHHIMHVLVVTAVYFMHQAAKKDLIWMSQPDACTALPSPVIN